MSKNPHEAPEHEVTPSSEGYERQDVNLTMITVLALLCIAVVVISSIGLNEYFQMTREQLYQENVLAKPDAKLLDLRQQEAAILTSYGYNAETNTYRVPIERAKQLLIERGAPPAD